MNPETLEEAFKQLPLERQMELLVHSSDRGSPLHEHPWLTHAKAQAHLARITIEQTLRLARSAERLELLTIVLIALTAVLAIKSFLP